MLGADEGVVFQRKTSSTRETKKRGTFEDVPLNSTGDDGTNQGKNRRMQVRLWDAGITSSASNVAEMPPELLCVVSYNNSRKSGHRGPSKGHGLGSHPAVGKVRAPDFGAHLTDGRHSGCSDCCSPHGRCCKKLLHSVFYLTPGSRT